MRAVSSIALAGALGAVWTTPCRAGPVDELRVGVMAHNICVTDCDNADKEHGVDLNAELAFASPSFMSRAGAPRPYLVLSLNTAGETSYAGGGLVWTWRFAERWRLEPGVGYVLHNNTSNLDNPYPPEDPRRGPFQEEELLLGSGDLFRTSLALTHDLTPRWGVQIAFEHLSHGEILGGDRNQGLDELGLRLSYRFGVGN